MTTTNSKWGGTRAALERADQAKTESAPALAPLPPPTQTEPERILAAADTELHQADEALTTLESRVRDGDEDVTAEEVEQARGLRRFAQLRREAAEKRAERVRQAAVDAEARQARAEFLEAIEPYETDDLAQLQEHITEAVYALLQAAAAQSRVVTAHARRFIKFSTTTEVPVSASVGGYGGISLKVDGTSYVPVGGQDLLAQALNAARQRHDNAAKQQDAEHHRVENERSSRLARSQIEQDARLYGDDRARFEELPARRRKPAVERLGMDWDQYERARARQA